MKKWCNLGQHDVDESNFWNNRSKPDGKESTCKFCRRNAKMDWEYDNRDKRDAIRAKYVQANKWEILARSHARRVSDDQVSFTPVQIKDMFDKQKKCLSCGSMGEPEIKNPLTVDHIVPISVGGDNSIDNIQILCKRCNVKKATAVKDYR